MAFGIEVHVAWSAATIEVATMEPVSSQPTPHKDRLFQNTRQNIVRNTTECSICLIYLYLYLSFSVLLLQGQILQVLERPFTPQQMAITHRNTSVMEKLFQRVYMNH